MYASENTQLVPMELKKGWRSRCRRAPSSRRSCRLPSRVHRHSPFCNRSNSRSSRGRPSRSPALRRRTPQDSDRSCRRRWCKFHPGTDHRSRKGVHRSRCCSRTNHRPRNFRFQRCRLGESHRSPSKTSSRSASSKRWIATSPSPDGRSETAPGLAICPPPM